VAAISGANPAATTNKQRLTTLNGGGGAPSPQIRRGSRASTELAMNEGADPSFDESRGVVIGGAKGMGTFEKSYEIEGERSELYGQEDEGGRRYQLVDSESLPIGPLFIDITDERTVVDLVRAVDEALGLSAA